MPDPFSIATGVAGLVTGFSKAAIGFQGLVSKYNGAPVVLSSVTLECKTLRMALNHISFIVHEDYEALESHIATNPLLAEDFETVIEGCSLAFCLLDEALQKLLRGNGAEVQSEDWKARLRYIWNEDEMKMILDQLRGLQGAVNLVLNALQTGMLSAVYQNTATRAPIIEQVKHQVASIRSDRTRREGSSFPDSASFTTTSYSSAVGDTEFSFDNELVNSRIYRQAMHAARRRGASASEESRRSTIIPAEEEMLIDLSDPPTSTDLSEPAPSNDLSGLVIAPHPDSWSTLPMLASELEPGGHDREILSSNDDTQRRGPLYNADSLMMPHVPTIEISAPKEWQDATVDQPFVGCVPFTRARASSAAPERDDLIRADSALRRSQSDSTRPLPNSITRPTMDLSAGLDISISCYARWLSENMVSVCAAYQITEPTFFQATFSRMDAHVVLTGDPCVGKTSLVNLYTAQQLSTSGTPFESSPVQGTLVTSEDQNYRQVFMTLHECGGGRDYCSGYLPLLAQRFAEHCSPLLCFSITKATSLANLLDYYLPQIREHYPASVIFLLGLTEHGRTVEHSTKKDSLIPRVECEKAARRCNATAYFEVALNDVIGIQQVMGRILGYTVANNFEKGRIARKIWQDIDRVKRSPFQSLRLLRNREKRSIPR